MIRPIPQLALDLCHEFEQGPGGGFAATPYADPAGHQTIGWGHFISPEDYFPNPIDSEAANVLLISDLEEAARGWEGTAALLNEGQYAALLSFAFNEGAGSLMGSTLFRDIQVGDYDKVPFELLRWVYARNDNGQMKQLPGLIRRRQWEGRVWSTGALPKAAS